MEGKNIRFTHLSTDQGLSQSRVDHMLQDRRGFIWMGTLNGLNRYDGYHFKIYKPEPNNPNSLGGLRVFAVLEDRSGTYGSASIRSWTDSIPRPRRSPAFAPIPTIAIVPPGTWNT